MHNHLAVLTALDTTLSGRPGMPPPQLVDDLAAALADPAFNNEWITNLAHGRPLAAALLFSRIAEQLSGQHRLEALAIAATASMRGGNLAIAANLITGADVTAARYSNASYPPALRTLKFNRAIRTYLGLQNA